MQNVTSDGYVIQLEAIAGEQTVKELPDLSAQRLAAGSCLLRLLNCSADDVTH